MSQIKIASGAQQEAIANTKMPDFVKKANSKSNLLSSWKQRKKDSNLHSSLSRKETHFRFLRVRRNVVEMMRLGLIFLLACSPSHGFLGPGGIPHTKTVADPLSSSQLNVVGVGKKYEPKWVKKETLGGDGLDEKAKGLIGDIPVVFKQGNSTKRTMALVGQPLSDVATQANQFIKYGCKKGECGTCECMVDGKWIRPCVETVPAIGKGEELVIQLKALKSKTTSSGKFYSVRSFLMGFYNNALGMVGFVRTRREAKKNWQDRLEYEELVRIKTLEKKAARASETQGVKP